jgi:hypothetical protein
MSLITEDDRKQYDAFVVDQLRDLGCYDYDPDATIWHYTKGPGLIGIIGSGTLRATDVYCLNDSTEVQYGQNLYREALRYLQEKSKEDEAVRNFLNIYLSAGNEEFSPDSPFFISCFSQRRDDLSQWRAYSEEGGENGYAIGFIARGLVSPFGELLRVNYDIEAHKKAAMRVAEATVEFFRTGLQEKSPPSTAYWAWAFVLEWDRRVARLATVLKASCFEPENELRFVHTHQSTDSIQFQQKTTLLGRHLSISFFDPPRLPIAEVLVGPGRHQSVTGMNVRRLLNQYSYMEVPVQLSQMPLQRP